MKIVLNEFKGILPKLANDKLPNNMAQVAADLKTASGELVAYRKSEPDVPLPGATYKSLFQYLEGGNSNWVYYDLIANWVRAPVANDTFERMYLTGSEAIAASGTITFLDTITDGETVTIGGETFEFDIADDGVGAGNTTVGTSATTTKELAAAAIAALTPEAAVSFTDNLDGTVTVTATATGTSGNSIVFSAVGAKVSVDGSGTLGGTQVGYARYKAFVNDIQGGGSFDFTTDFYYPGAPSGTAPTVTPDASAGDYVAYYYTYVSRYGEEGPPSAIGESIAATDDGRNDVDDIETPPVADEHLYTIVDGNIPKVYLYRTVDTAQPGVAAFLFILEAEWFDTGETYEVGEYVVYLNDIWECTVQHTGAWNAGNFNKGENVLDVDAGSVGTSIFYDRAPEDLTGLRGHPGGFFVAFKDNTLFFSEPWAPWAWPEDYQIPLDHTIVSVGVFGSTIVVATDGFCYTFSGPHPSSLYKTRLAFQPCLSQRGLVETDDGVMFPSPEGFQMVSAAGITNVTADMFSPEDWADYELDTIHGTWYNKAYYGFYKDTEQGNIRIDFLNASITTGVDYHQAGYVSLEDGTFNTIFNSSISAPGTQYISLWDSATFQFRNYSYKSPRFILERPANFKVAQLILDTDFYNELVAALAASEDVEDANQAAWDETDYMDMLQGPLNSHSLNGRTLNGDTLLRPLDLGLLDYITFNVYVNSVLKFSKQVSNSQMFKLPRGFKHKKWEIEVKGMIPIKRIIMASSTEELQNGSPSNTQSA